MRQIVKVSVDHQGELHLDFSGYEGRVCELEESELRRILAELGLQVRPKHITSKNNPLPSQPTYGSKERTRVCV